MSCFRTKMLIDNKYVIPVIERCQNPTLNGAEILDTVNNTMEKYWKKNIKTTHYLQFREHFKDSCVNSSYAVTRKLRCQSSNERIFLLHNGRQRSGIFIPYITERNLLLVTECSKCNLEIVLYGNI